jgi:hypothetical protein
LEGWIKDYRKELDSDIWLMPPLYHRVWQYLKYKVNHLENDIPMHDGTVFRVKPGQHLSSLRGIATGVGWFEGKAWKEPNPKTIKKILDYFEKCQTIKQEHGRGNREYTLVTLINWELYQSENLSSNSKRIRVETARTQPVDINKNDKNTYTSTDNKRTDLIQFADKIFLTIEQYNTFCEKCGKGIRYLHYFVKLQKQKADGYKPPGSDYEELLKIYSEENGTG